MYIHKGTCIYLHPGSPVNINIIAFGPHPNRVEAHMEHV